MSALPLLPKRLLSLLIFLIFLVMGYLWILKPLPPSPLESAVHQEAYLVTTFRSSLLSRPPWSTLAFQGGSTQGIPRWLGWVLPPLISMDAYGRDTRIGAGWSLLADLGWRAQIFSWLSPFIQDRLTGNLRLFQDQGTLFVSTNPYFLDDLRENPAESTPRETIFPFLTNREMTKETMVKLGLSNRKDALTQWVNERQSEVQFLIFPSAQDIDTLSTVIREDESNILQGDVLITIDPGKDPERVKSDIEYLLDLLDRLLSTGGIQMKKEVRLSSQEIRVILTIPHSDRLSKVPWHQLRMGST